MRLFFLCCSLLAADSMLEKADLLGKQFRLEQGAARFELNANVWLSVDLAKVKAPVFETLSSHDLWNALQDLGMEGVWLKGLKSGGMKRVGLEIDPKWGHGWARMSSKLQEKGILLVCDSMGVATGVGPDFLKAIKNEGDHAALYRMNEVGQGDWGLLPTKAAALSWLQMKGLQEKGYVSGGGRWNVTGKVQGVDGKARRFVYLRNTGVDPVLNWLSPSFSACRIATADILDSVFNVGAKVIAVPASLPANAKQLLSLFSKKLGAFALLDETNGIEEMKENQTDLVSDTPTRAALFQAIVNEDASELKTIYTHFLSGKIEMKRLLHTLAPFEPARFFSGKKVKPLSVIEARNRRAQILEKHLLLSFFYAMQPGVLSVSFDELIGYLDKEETLYGSIESQMGNRKSFASQLRAILQIRKEHDLHLAKLISVLPTKSKGALFLLFQKENSSEQLLLGVNFSQNQVNEALSMPGGINLFANLTESNPFSLLPLTAKAILFLPRNYD